VLIIGDGAKGILKLVLEEVELLMDQASKVRGDWGLKYIKGGEYALEV
jgi:hypothetical protein